VNLRPGAFVFYPKEGNQKGRCGVTVIGAIFGVNDICAHTQSNIQILILSHERM
jgi:hypothetical protein